MQNFEYYRLEIPCNAKAKKYMALEYSSTALKIIALILIIPLYKYFYISVALWVISVLLNVFKRNLVYRYVYTVADGVLTVEKEYGYDKKILCEKVDLQNAAITSDDEAVIKYYENPTEITISVNSEGKVFSIDVDEYFYAVTEFYCKNGVNR